MMLTIPTVREKGQETEVIISCIILVSFLTSFHTLLQCIIHHGHIILQHARWRYYTWDIFRVIENGRKSTMYDNSENEETKTHEDHNIEASDA